MYRVNSGSFRQKNKIPLWLRIFLVALVSVGLSLGLYFMVMSWGNSAPTGPTDVDLMQLWDSGEYEEIIAYTDEELKNKPLDTVSLILGGFSYFHKGILEIKLETKLEMVQNAISRLRKAILLPNTPLLPQIYYILGKAYFHKGRFYSDLAIHFLKRALDLNYIPSDLYEYLGLTYFQLSLFEKSRDYFNLAVENNPSELLLWTLAQTHFQTENYSNALLYLNQVLSKTKDRGLEQKTLFLTAEIQVKLDQLEAAEATYNKILSINSNSADAHFYMGEIYQLQGNREKARSAYRRALRIDPFHFNASRRL